jgi:hypothetical protein
LKGQLYTPEALPIELNCFSSCDPGADKFPKIPHLGYFF